MKKRKIKIRIKSKKNKKNDFLILNWQSQNQKEIITKLWQTKGRYRNGKQIYRKIQFRNTRNNKLL
ncbi:MAG: hypothetical protein K9J16_17250, partial [Melioribacteraceae bacterium]|nr:hypothetical protein [Melioribacteraceae bacterium]MCF8354777.1 hypothetical protein [Melioribacteraceae bacterium]MCF8393329.1 hypothetical protein [Melioribacteraceae bacterium]MCF8419181.1 hypothetical protein [Melioribacteraceae bacterium]